VMPTLWSGAEYNPRQPEDPACDWPRHSPSQLTTPHQQATLKHRHHQQEYPQSLAEPLETL
jgi:hypothetical protein